MIEQFIAFVVVPLGFFLFGKWVGIRSERATWTGAAFDAPKDHVRCKGRDYMVMSLDQFYRKYANPLADAKFRDARRRAVSHQNQSAMRAEGEPPPIQTPTKVCT